ncbi:unnamed protein product [Rangifer tarandus platyrhynchus]|uniref:Uncharacterized protein n=2 Tax=Rangifer tarandus platyrhynchus TaxID=3082113 RepID=A0AC59Y542_RANTA|nr:unnamed protein product [Rangifer tarandus platyrhynchus]
MKKPSKQAGLACTPRLPVPPGDWRWRAGFLATPGSECSPGTQASAWAQQGTGRTCAVGAGQLCAGEVGTALPSPTCPPPAGQGLPTGWVMGGSRHRSISGAPPSPHYYKVESKPH